METKINDKEKNWMFFLIQQIIIVHFTKYWIYLSLSDIIHVFTGTHTDFPIFIRENDLLKIAKKIRKKNN